MAAASHSSASDSFASRLGRGAASRLKQAAETVEETSRRAARRLNRSLNLQEQGRKAQAAASEGAAWLDQQFEIKRRLHLLMEFVQRDYPKWRRQLREFNQSAVGRAFWTLALVYSMYTGVFFTALFAVLRVFFLLVWVMPLLLSMRTLGGQVAAAQAQQRAAAAAAAQQQAARRNPFGGYGGFGGQPFGQRGGRHAPDVKPGPNYAQQPGGPVIDAEWETIDEGDQ